MAAHPVPKQALLREFRRYQKKIRQAAARRARHVPVSSRKPKLRGSKAPEELGRLLLILAERLSQHPSWRSYTWREDLVSAGVVAMLHACTKFNTKAGTSPFAYLTMTCWRAFNGELQKQKRRGLTGATGKDYEVLSFPTDPRFGMFERERAPDGRFGLDGP